MFLSTPLCLCDSSPINRPPSIRFPDFPEFHQTTNNPKIDKRTFKVYRIADSVALYEHHGTSVESGWHTEYARSPLLGGRRNCIHVQLCCFLHIPARTAASTAWHRQWTIRPDAVLHEQGYRPGKINWLLIGPLPVPKIASNLITISV